MDKPAADLAFAKAVAKYVADTTEELVRLRPLAPFVPPVCERCGTRDQHKHWKPYCSSVCADTLLWRAELNDRR